MISLRRAAPSLALLVLQAGCFAAPVPEDALISCSVEADCPVGFGCALEVGRCIPSEVLAAPGPQLEGEATVSPSLARAGVDVRVAFQADQALGEPPFVSIEGSDFAFALVEEESDKESARFVYRASIGAASPAEGAHALVAAVKSLAGRPAVLRLGTVIVDRTANRVDGALAVGGALGVGASAELSFSVLEPVDDDHLPRVFFVDEGLVETEAWALESGDGTSFTFRYTVSDPPSLPAGVHEVRVRLLDNAGNESVPLPAGAITLDVRAPVLVESAVSILPTGEGAGLLGAPVTAAGPGARVTVAFGVDEALAGDPDVELRCPGDEVVALARAPNDVSALFFRYLLDVVDDVSPEGSCTLHAAVVDPAGNATTLELGALIIDHTAPAPLVDGTGAGATLARAPWGAADLDGDGTADRGTLVLLDAPSEPGLVAVVFDAASGGLLVRGPADAPLQLGAQDRRDVEVAAVDAAGNVSPRTVVTQGLWVATLGDKIADSNLENPHRGVTHRALPSTLDAAGGAEVGAELAGVDGQTAKAVTSGRWRRGPDGGSLDLARFLAAVAWDSARGVAVAFGGSENAIPTDDTWEWDGTTWRRVSLSHRPPAREGAAMAYDQRRGVMVLFGGVDAAGNTLDDTWELDGVWRERVVTGPSPRGGTQASYDPIRGEVVLFGGESLDGTLLDDTWTYDGMTWTAHGSGGPPPRARAGMTFDEASEAVVLFGGIRDVGDLSPWLWDGTSWTERVMSGPAPFFDNVGYHEHRVAFDHARQQVVALMMNAGQSFEIELAAIGESAWEPVSNVGLLSRAGAAMLFDPHRRELFIAGGDFTIPTQLLGEGAAGFATASASPGVRSRLAGTFDPRSGAPLFIAGLDSATQQPDSWSYDGHRFRQVDSYSHPRAYLVEAFTRGNDAYSFGGVVQSVGFTNQLRRFNGSTWANVGVAGTPPSARAESPLCLDEASGDVILFGGQGPGSSVFGDTFRLRDTTWTPLALTPAPSARFGHAMAYDRSREGIVLYGGDVDDNALTTPLADTWLFKDGAWSDISGLAGPGPGPRTHHQMATDPVTGLPLLYGGLGANGVQDNKLYELGPSGWSVVQAADPPAPTYRGVLVEDPLRRQVVLFGGIGRDDVSTFDRAVGGHPAVAFYVDVTPLGLQDATVLDVEAFAVAGGAGEDPDAGAITGAGLYVYSAGRWIEVAANDASLASLAGVESGALAPYDVLFRDRAISVALVSRGENGAVPATVEVDHVELRVRYRR